MACVRTRHDVVSQLTRAVLANLPEGAFTSVISGVRRGQRQALIPSPIWRGCACVSSPAGASRSRDSVTGFGQLVAAGYPTLVIPHTVPVPPIDGSLHRACSWTLTPMR